MLTRRRLLTTAAIAAPSLALSAQRTSEPSVKLPTPILALRDRSHEAVPMTAAERQNRIARARELLTQNKLSALTITGGTSLDYFLGIRSGQSERLFAWTLPATGTPFIVCPTFEEGRVHESLQTSPNGASTRVYTWNEDDDPYALLAKSLKSSTLSPLPLGIDERTQYVFADRIAQAVAPRLTTSAIPVISGCRSIKSPAELALMQLANDITWAVYKAVYESCSPGITTTTSPTSSHSPTSAAEFTAMPLARSLPSPPSRTAPPPHR